MNADTLRSAIEDALRRSDGTAIVLINEAPLGFRSVDALALRRDSATTARRPDKTDALRALAAACGLVVADDGTVSDALDEVARLREEIAALTADRDEWMSTATERGQDRDALASASCRNTVTLTFEQPNGTRQSVTTHTFPDGRAYAPILGATPTVYPSIYDLAKVMERAFGDGFRFVKAQPGVTP